MSAGILPSRVAVVGLGYVGLPLAVAFARRLPTVGFDGDPARIDELRRGIDRNGEVPADAIRAEHLTLSPDAACLDGADFIIVAVPTPVDAGSSPDLSALRAASATVGRAIGRRQGSGRTAPVVVYESTVYPGCTEEVCVPILEAESGTRAGAGFTVGYSPERINFGDTDHTLSSVVKVVAGRDEATSRLVAAAYELVVEAGVHVAPDIQTAEAAKVVENVQRDLNIALVNELSVLFHRMGLDSAEVLAAARTKWNFLGFEPGLVGGHCIPVDPYYLTHRAREIGYEPQVILAGRRLNDSMAEYVAGQTARLLEESGAPLGDARVLVLGVAFKEDIRDARNSQAARLAAALSSRGADVAAYDPLLGRAGVEPLGLQWVDDPFDGSGRGRYDAVVLAVPHARLRDTPVADYVKLLDTARGRGVLVDVRRTLPVDANRLGGVICWGL